MLSLLLPPGVNLPVHCFVLLRITFHCVHTVSRL